jgi:hypothetical protein
MRLTTVLLFAAACTKPVAPNGGSNPDLSLSLAGDLAVTPVDLSTGGAADLTMLAMNDLAALPPDGQFGSYPAGPYGHTVGATFPPLVWEGYVATTGDVVVNTLPFGSYSADAMRTSGKRYALVHVSEFF